jgi:hypothetical protein
MEPIKFILGEESRPKIETFSDVNHSLFKDQYEKVFEEIVSYVLDKPTNNDPNSENKNNLFAFIGERGSGKTSCMLSVANMLTASNKRFAQTFKNDLTKELDNENFLTIDLVDPSFFDQKHNILDIVIAKLFKSFSDDIKKSTQNRQQNYESKKQQVIDKFQETKENLNLLLNSNNDSDDSLEQLTGLAAAVDLKDNLKKLFDAYLEYFLCSRNAINKGFLLIKIDDIDLHTKHAYEMVEQIRKYIIQPNVIVLIAVKLDQLSNVIKLQYKKDFDSIISENDLEGMVDKYIVKLLPLNGRIFLPDANVYINNPLCIYDNKDDNVPKLYNSIREAVPTLIFLKTRYLFYNTNGATSYIIPRNLRELRHLVKLLYNLSDYRADKTRPEYNKIIFKKYLFESWVSNNLNTKSKLIVNNILLTNDAVRLNKKVIKLLKEYFKEIIDLIVDKSELFYILRDTNQTYNISVGDIFAYISYLEGLSANEEDQKLIFIVKTIYSIKLYEFYDEVTENYTDSPNSTEEQEVIKQEFMRDFSNYEKLASGSFINSAYFDLLPPTSKKSSRSLRQIDGLVILDIISKIKEGKDDDISIIKIEKDVSDKQPLQKVKNEVLNITDKLSLTKSLNISKSNALRLVEFFALTTSRRYDSQDVNEKDNADKLYRSKREIYYSESLKQQNIFFDISSVLFNVLDIERAYNRFDPTLLDIAKNDEKSIYKRLTIEVSKRYKVKLESCDEINNRLLSWTSIRNIEILEAFTDHLIINKPKGSGDDKSIVKEFFKNMSSFKIQSYDMDSNKKHHDIDFSYVGILEEVLDETNSDVFNLIFSQLIEKKERKKSELNINLSLKAKGTYDKNTIWLKLSNKNEKANEDENIRLLFDKVFVSKTKMYAQEEANSLLRLLKLQYNG